MGVFSKFKGVLERFSNGYFRKRKIITKET